MKFYRISLTSVADGHQGYEYTTTKPAANAIQKGWLESATEEDGHASSVEEIDIKPTKAGILAALKMYADHAENG